MRVRVTNCSNNYGPRQFPEKLIPLMILRCLSGEPLPIYGKGANVRDWLFVDDHCDAIWAVISRGVDGETYNIGGGAEMKNIDVVERICRIVAAETGRDVDALLAQRVFVTDRPGHDLRYAIDATKIERELGFRPSESFDSGLEKTVRWYLANTEWIEDVKSGAYRTWMEAQYGARGGRS
jgi:dTDP-glucose 4,6-dehydratase